ncbi:hypothetical protein GCM10009839_40020 [Catenulispora yoronensis]|uniref:Uncharacterized protein n=1 Tax=Catenulispora yoronensis TaxID=450799 RepID=A0ABP5G044_9ACTN
MSEQIHEGPQSGAADAAQVLSRVIALEDGEHKLDSCDLRWTEQRGWVFSAQSGTYIDEADDIDLIRWWADALDGVTHLAETKSYQLGSVRRFYRELSARATVSGIAVEIWNHIAVREESLETPAAAVAYAT